MTEKDLHQYNAHGLIENTNKIGIFRFDAITKEIYWNSVLKEIFEVSQDYTPDLENIISFFNVENDKNRFIKAHTEAIEHGFPFELDHQIITDKGNLRHLWVFGQPVFEDGKCAVVYGISMNITQRKEIELELQKRNALLSFAEQMTKIGYWQWNMITNEVIWSNGLHQIYEHDNKFPVTYETYFDYIYHEDKDQVENALKMGLEKGEFNSTYRIQLKNGSLKTINSFGKVIKRANGQVTEMQGTCQDVTESKNRELELLQRNKQLAEFNHITSHNLRAPVGNLNTLLEIYKNPAYKEIKEEVFEKFETVINHLTLTLDTLVETLKVKYEVNQTIQKLSFDKVLLKTKEILAAEILQTGAIFKSDFSQVPTILYKQIYLESIFLNLISNSIKYKSLDRVPKIEIFSEKVNGHICLRFKDNGTGIDLKKHGHKLFGLNKVFHKHPDAKGVGLFMTKVQIEAMGGSITAQSEVNVGTIFTLILI